MGQSRLAWSLLIARLVDKDESLTISSAVLTVEPDSANAQPTTRSEGTGDVPIQALTSEQGDVGAFVESRRHADDGGRERILSSPPLKGHSGGN
jgi:hypothetical protein